MTSHSTTPWQAGTIETPIGPVSVAAGPNGVFHILLGRDRAYTLQALREDFGKPDAGGGEMWAANCLRQIDEYFNGERKRFQVPLDRRSGTAFQRSVWSALGRIPYGRTLSYGEVAEKIGKPGAARAVGGACGANPVPLVVPCHRVVASGGGLGGFGSGLDVKRWLLEFEETNR